MLESVTLNWVAILVAGVLNVVLGAVWYSPALFGKSWMQLMGVKEMKPNATNILGMFVIALISAVIFRYFIGWIGVDTFGVGLEVGILAALGFFALPMASGTIAGKGSWTLWAINGGYWVVAFALMGGVLASMK